MEVITSKENATIKEIRKLKDKKQRDQTRNLYGRRCKNGKRGDTRRGKNSYHRDL